MSEKRDIFDAIMDIKILKPLNPFYKKHKEGLLYLFFGGLTFLLVTVVYAWLEQGIDVNPLVANIISWITGVTFSFFTTRKWVFESTVNTFKEIIVQMAGFYAARTATLLLQELLILIFVVWLGFNSIVIKICTEIINIILNYIVSKLVIFKK